MRALKLPAKAVQQTGSRAAFEDVLVAWSRCIRTPSTGKAIGCGSQCSVLSDAVLVEFGVRAFDYVRGVGVTGHESVVTGLEDRVRDDAVPRIVRNVCGK